VSASILDQYVTSIPSAQNALDIFQNEWASKFPGSLAALRAGQIPTFEDIRISWAIEQLGGIRGQRVLELGPLEAGHTYMLEQAGAASIVAIEANSRAYLKCLIVKEILHLKRSEFLCGDFVAYLRTDAGRFDCCLASGVLYHMTNPVELISLIAKICDRVCLWTHYFDYKTISSNPTLVTKFHLDGVAAEYQGFQHTLYRQEYQAALDVPSFCGGSQPFSHWMSREDILAALRFFGFKNIAICDSLDQLAHQNGPCFCLVAQRD
jgi:hypothetical protein